MSLVDDVLAARKGDRPAFARLHARWHPVVHAILLARLDPVDAEDHVQDVFMTAWRRLPELRSPEAFGGWICAIARNAALDALRARRHTTPLRDEPAPDPGDDAVVRETLAAIRTLPEAYRETLLMRLVEDLTGPEIAARTGLTEGSVRVNLHRGMALLREKLGGAA